MNTFPNNMVDELVFESTPQQHCLTPGEGPARNDLSARIPTDPLRSASQTPTATDFPRERSHSCEFSSHPTESEGSSTGSPMNLEVLHGNCWTTRHATAGVLPPLTSLYDVRVRGRCPLQRQRQQQIPQSPQSVDDTDCGVRQASNNDSTTTRHGYAQYTTQMTHKDVTLRFGLAAQVMASLPEKGGTGYHNNAAGVALWNFHCFLGAFHSFVLSEEVKARWVSLGTVDRLGVPLQPVPHERQAWKVPPNLITPGATGHEKCAFDSASMTHLLALLYTVALDGNERLTIIADVTEGHYFQGTQTIRVYADVLARAVSSCQGEVSEGEHGRAFVKGLCKYLPKSGFADLVSMYTKCKTAMSGKSLPEIFKFACEYELELMGRCRMTEHSNCYCTAQQGRICGVLRSEAACENAVAAAVTLQGSSGATGPAGGFISPFPLPGPAAPSEAASIDRICAVEAAQSRFETTMMRHMENTTTAMEALGASAQATQGSLEAFQERIESRLVALATASAQRGARPTPACAGCGVVGHFNRDCPSTTAQKKAFKDASTSEFPHDGADLQWMHHLTVPALPSQLAKPEKHREKKRASTHRSERPHPRREEPQPDVRDPERGEPRVSEAALPISRSIEHAHPVDVSPDAPAVINTVFDDPPRG